MTDFTNKIEQQLRQRIETNPSRVALEHALAVCKHAHAGQRRDDGSDYFTHTVSMALLLLDLVPNVPGEVLCGALLHDTLEDTDYTAERLLNDFGPAVLEIVQGCTREFPHSTDPAERHADKQQHHDKLLKASPFVRLVKCADALDNLRAMHDIPEDHKNHAKLPRWLNEAETQALPLAQMTHPALAQAIADEIAYCKNAGLVAGDWRGA